MRASNGDSDHRRQFCFLGVVLAVLVAWIGGAGPVWADDDDEKFVVVHAGKVIPVEGEEIRNGTIVIVDGKVRLVGKDLDYPKNATIIDAPDETVMPAWIHARSRWELAGYTRDGVHGDLSTAVEYFPTVDQFEELLEHGFAIVALYPAGSGAPGRAILRKTGGPIDGRVIEEPSYLRITLNKLPKDKKTLSGAFKKAKKEIEKVEKAKKEFEEKQKKTEEEAKKKKQEKPKPDEEKKEEKKKDKGKEPESQPSTQPTTQPAKPEFKPPPIDPAHQVFVDLIQKKEGVFALVEIRSASNLLHFEDAIADFEFDHRFFLSTGYYADFDEVADKLGEAKTKVLTYARLNRAPYSAKRVNIPAILSRAGCDVALVPTADNEHTLDAFRQRLAVLVRSGLPREKAIKALTLNAAAILGIDKEYGTIEKDKLATLTFFAGDPLDPLAPVTRVMIDGEIVYEPEELDP